MAINLEPILKKLGDDLIEQMRIELLSKYPHPAKASGKLLNGFKKAVDENTLKIINEASDGGYFYSGNVDLGRRPGKMPLVSKIREWMERKGVTSRDSKTGRFMRKRDGAFVIAKKIADYGYDGIDYTGNAIRKFSNYIVDSLGEKYVEELNEMLKENISRFELKD